MTKIHSVHPHCRTLTGVAHLLLAALFVGGCASAPVQSTKPPADSTASEPAPERPRTTIAVAPPAVTLHQLSAGGVREQRDDWTTAALENTRTTLESLRPEQIIHLRDANLAPELATELAEVQALFRTINANIAIFGHPQIGPPTAVRRFDHSVGSVDQICDAVGADTLLLIHGENDYFTGGRKFMTGLGVIASVAASAVTNSGVMVTPPRGAEYICAALVARDGRLIWYQVLGAGSIGDLRDPEGTRRTIQNLLRSMPENRTAH